MPGTDDRDYTWERSEFNLRFNRRLSDGQVTSVWLRHPTAPFVSPLDEISPAALQNVALVYLKTAISGPEMDPPLDPLPRWLDLLSNGSPVFVWVPLGWPEHKAPREALDPHGSFWVDAPGDKPPDRASVLFACDGRGNGCIGSGFGIRVIVCLRLEEKGWEAHITGMSASLPHGRYTKGLWTEDWSADADVFAREIPDGIKGNVKIVLRLPDQKSVSIRGTRIYRDADNKDWRVERQVTDFHEVEEGKGVTRSYVLEGTLEAPGTLISQRKLVANADGEARLFKIDPASNGKSADIRKRRPTRTEAQLDQYRERVRIFPTKLGALKYPRTNELVRVMVSPRFVPADKPATPGGPPNAGDPKKVYLDGRGPPIRCNDFAAVSAYYHVKSFFDRLTAYGRIPKDYFRIVKLPVKIAYRSGILPGPGKDGQTVNARVHVDGWKGDFVGPTALDERPSVEMHLALANLSHRSRHRGRRGEPLAIAADARWIWHELGHVVLMAALGELEFRFAHSPGDALAAIVADPPSKLDGRWRGVTFPWVFATRRHDRSALRGWSWGGTQHRGISEIPDSFGNRSKGYRTEQILSSSLFRMYRALGGDTLAAGLPDIKARETASHYSVYLILRAIELLGTSALVLANDADQLVSKLILADSLESRWNVEFPTKSGNKYARVGGCAHKVIEWAFEAQGMNAPPGKITNGPGRPPPVDVFIADRRPVVDTSVFDDIEHGPGSYVPVSLHWDPGQNEANDAPLWQATADAIKVQGNSITVTVGNRGAHRANNVTVRVLFREWPAGTNQPLWEPASPSWRECTPDQTAAQNIDPKGSASFSFTHGTGGAPAKRYIIFAQATCDDDRANTEQATKLPSSKCKTPLVDLVSGDNNLGLRVVKDP